MPIVWRYLLAHYFKVLIFCTISFIAVLLTTRLDEIAHFATLGPDGISILLYTLHQIPYILPIAIPISCLISSILLIQRLSRTHELTALRASGISIASILSPMLLASLLICLFNFFIVSEQTTRSHMMASFLKNEVRSINPLLVINNKHLMKLKGIYYNSLGHSKLGEYADDVIIAMPNNHQDRLNVLIAKKVQATPSSFIGNQITFFTSLKNESPDKADHLIVENIGKLDTNLHDFAQLMQKKVWSLNYDHLKLSFLLLRLSEKKQALSLVKNEPSKWQEKKNIKLQINDIYIEILRRVSVALAAFTFTFMGASFGISISRNRSNKGVICVITMAAFYLIAYMTAKSISGNFWLCLMLYSLPHLMICLISFKTLLRASRGIES